MTARRLTLRTWAAALLLALPTTTLAQDFDPFSTRDGIAASPAKTLLAAPGDEAEPCRFDALGAPLALVEAVERALCHDPQSRQAWANTKVQAAQVGVAKSAYLPTVAATLAISRQNSRTTYREFPVLDSNVRPTIRSGGLKMSMVLTDFGLRGANLDQARALLDAANATHDATLQAVFVAAAQAYFDTQTAQATLDASREAERAAKESFAAAEAKYRAGIGALTDQLQAQTAYSKALLDRVSADGELKNAQGSLATAMGLAANTPMVLAKRRDTLPDTAFVKPVDELIDEARQNHPALIAAQAQFKAAQARIEAVSAEGRPTVSLASEVSQSEQLHQPPSLGLTPSDISTRSASVGVQVSIPLFEGFGRSYRVQAARDQAEIKQAELAGASQQIILEVWKSYQALRTEDESIKAAEELAKSARMSFKVAQGRYKAGVGNILETLNAQSAQANAEQQRIKSISRWHTARLKLAASVGKLGLWAIQ
ncbi:MAG: TolC family protein [Sulfuricella sp.]|nr:TolC family protein [Sulfuricella sp.]